jgi:2-polyprenyl-6-methoxyphenol hydroxylase-like FAD-dependent oxidoreductase
MTAAAKPPAIVIGTSIAGLAAALALGQRGFTITCIERDAAQMPRDHLDAFAKWDRRGAAQTRHSHVLLAPLVKLLKSHASEFYAEVLHAGAEELGFAELAQATFGDVALEPDDVDICCLACRRVVFEFLLRRYIAQPHGEQPHGEQPHGEQPHGEQPHGVRIIDGATVTALQARPGDPPQITGIDLQYASGKNETLTADLVIDASGRHGATEAWLTAVGARTPLHESSPCGIFYTSRFYRLHDHAGYPEMEGRKSVSGGVQVLDLGYLKVGVFRADNRTFSIALAADPEDKPMRAVANQREFEIAVSNIEATQSWVDPATAAAISKVYLYGNLSNVRRRFVLDGKPVALGYFAIGDAHVHTNPISGRGCALGWVTAFALADVLAAESDPTRRALAFEERIDTQIVPWYRVQVRQDKQSLDINKALQRGEDPYGFIKPDGCIDEEKQRLVIFRKGFGAAAREHLDVLRALFRQTNLLDLPEALFTRHDLLAKVLACYEKNKTEELQLRPRRDEMLALFAGTP